MMMKEEDVIPLPIALQIFQLFHWPASCSSSIPDSATHVLIWYVWFPRLCRHFDHFPWFIWVLSVLCQTCWRASLLYRIWNRRAPRKSTFAWFPSFRTTQPPQWFWFLCPRSLCLLTLTPFPAGWFCQGIPPNSYGFLLSAIQGLRTKTAVAFFHSINPDFLSAKNVRTLSFECFNDF